ncbi:MAG: alpha/beta hydrolase family protein [Polyangiaceae bacterium]|nr:alpha/beta hydrolase family protein [Polyangiaceae bacterium]
MTVVSRIVHEGGGPRPSDDDRPWWESLPADFHRSRERFDMTRGERAKVAATAASDVVLRTLGATLVGALAIPVGYHPWALSRALGDRELYGSMADGGDPDRFFVRPLRGVEVQRRRARLPLFRPRDGVCEDVRFQSPFVPVNLHERRAYLRHGRNRFAHARHWRHGDEPRPTVIAVHGFSADLYHLNEWFFAIPWLYREGYDVMLVTLPFHGKRQTRLSPFSGHGFFAGGVNRINEAMAQAIFDLRIFMDHLEDQGVPRMGVTGVSLGGFTAALLASVDARLAFAIPNVPVASIADLVLEWQPIASVLAAALAATGKDVRDARQLLSVSCPLSYPPRLPRERLMIIGGVGDRLAPPTHSRLLWDHWGRCRIHWFPGSHLVHLDRGDYFRQTRRFLREIEFK